MLLEIHSGSPADDTRAKPGRTQVVPGIEEKKMPCVLVFLFSPKGLAQLRDRLGLGCSKISN